ncbi:MAG: MBL fold metallo-hydrolase [Firmicutes bacterium]|nr:MBL fold metallo-hydrolase [Bacillota bacterium]
MKVSVLSSGSKGNCTYIETNNHKILIDIGTSSLYVEKSLKSIGINPEDIDMILITHAHIDHVNGLRVFSKKYNPLVYISDKILKESNLKIENVSSEEEILVKNDVSIRSIRLSHDVTDIKGYVIEEENSSMVYITDTGYINENNFEYIKNKNLYVFESNHDVEKLMNNPKYPHHTKIRILSDKGHLSNKDSAYYLSKLIGNDTHHIILAHLSEQNNTEELALSTLKETLERKNINFKNIKVARQNEMTELMEV